ncbi:hypothetical protein [Cohnella sp. JJ-181]|uniref:hypothetical protein n=1 Tax=Cohnella rhizoplanae TaxID=2974897 RepID=UPI0022FF6586|nr:hypothetical protein [Cohnella sp. JJ-181]CAI6054837.1 hypothetical protein COHCIP112018_01630 [Cohnella sp. JJ-181]
MSFFDDGPLPNWDAIRTMIGRDLPWDLIKQWDNKDDSWLNDYISKLGLGALAGQAGRAGQGKGAESGQSATVSAKPQMEARKEARRVVATIKPPAGADRRDIRLYATADRLRVSGLTGAEAATLKLPCLVVPKSGRVTWKNGKWVVVFRRRPASLGEVELFIGE